MIYYNKLTLILHIVFLFSCNNNRYEINYFDDNKTLKSFSIVQNDSIYYKMFFSKQEELEYIASSSMLLIKNNNKLFQFPIKKTSLDDIKSIIDSFRINDTIKLIVYNNNNLLPWISECNLAYLRIGVYNEYYNKILLKAWNDYIEKLKKFNLDQISNINDDELHFSNFNELEKYYETEKYLTFKNLLNFKHSSSDNKLNFKPLYQNINYLNFDLSFKYLNKINYNSCIDIDNYSDSNKFLTFRYFWNDTDEVIMAYFWFRKLKEIKLEDYTITKFKTDKNNYVEVSVIFHKTGLYNMNITNVLPFKGVDMNSDDNNRPFMTFSTNDFMIKVLPEN